MGKFKKFALIGLASLGTIGVARCMVVKFNAYLVNETGLAVNKTYPLSLNSYGVDFLSFTSIASSVTFSVQNFTDGQKSTGTITVTSASGILNSNLSLNGYNISFSTIGTTTQIAASIASGINTNANLNTSVVASTSGAVVFTTSTQVGLFTNYVMTSSTQSSLTIGGPVTITNGASIGQMWGGSDSAYTLVSGSATVFNIANHGFTLGLPVLYATTSGQAITGLTAQTTYYVIPVTQNALSLASSSANAVLGVAVVATSTQAKTTADSFRLTPLAITGTPSYKWQVSNDGMNWIDYTTNDQGVAVSSVSLAAYTSTGTITSWDFGEVEYAFIRLNVTSPTQGAIRLQVAGNGKNSNN